MFVEKKNNQQPRPVGLEMMPEIFYTFQLVLFGRVGSLVFLAPHSLLPP